MDWNEDIEKEIQKEMSSNGFINRAWGVKIILHDGLTVSAINKVVYYNKGFRFNLYMKYQWYWRYRTALFQVENPKKYVELVKFEYDVKEKEVEELKRKKDIIAARKRKLTIAKQKLEEYKKSFNALLFSIDDDFRYLEAVKKVESYERKLKEVEDKNFIPVIYL